MAKPSMYDRRKELERLSSAELVNALTKVSPFGGYTVVGDGNPCSRYKMTRARAINTLLRYEGYKPTLYRYEPGEK